MKAVIKATEEYGSLKVADMPKPKPQERQALIRIKATAICNTDASIINNKYVGRKPVPIPLILGHEGAGIVEELGEGVEGLEVGDHVALEPIYGCGHCEHCKKGYPNMCQAWNHTGITEHGTFAEYVTVPANNAHKISDKLDFAAAGAAKLLLRLQILIRQRRWRSISQRPMGECRYLDCILRLVLVLSR